MLVPLLRPWTRQPPATTRANLGLQLTRGLRLLVSPGYAGPVDATGQRILQQVGTVVSSPTSGGIAGTIDGSNYINVTNDTALYSNTLSVFALQYQITAPASNFNTAFVNAKDTSYTDVNGWHFQIDNTSLFFAATGSTFVLTTAPSSLGLHSYGATYSAGAARLFIDGAFATSGTVGSSISKPTNPLRIGNSVWKNDNANKILLVAVWDRTLTDAEQVALHRNPWQLFAPQTSRIWVPSAAGVPTLTSIAASSITSSGATLTIN